MSGDPEQDAGVRLIAAYFAAWIISVVLVAVLGWPGLAEIAIFAVLFGAGLALWERRRRHD